MPEVQVGNLPFREAIQYIQEKLLIPSNQYTDLIGPIHAKGFTVAGATTLGIVQDFYQAVQNSILDGTTITDFRKDFDNIVARYGWSYKGQRGWRTNVIFRMNKLSAQMAGRWAQYNRVKEQRPYLEYLTVGDERVRPEHAKWNGVILPIDHPFWNTHYPPNDFLCRCKTRSLSQDDLNEEGKAVSQIETPQPVEVADPKTGEVFSVYPGVGRGFDFNVGKAWLAPDVLLGQQLLELPKALREKALKWFENDIYDQAFKSMTNKVAMQLARGKSNVTTGIAQNIGFLSNQIVNKLIDRNALPIGLAVVVRDADIAHWLRDAKANRGASVSVSLAASLPEIFRKPDAILWDSLDPSLIYAKRLADGRYAKFVLKLNFKAKLNVNKSRFRETLNTFKSAGIVDWSNLNGSRFELLEGSIKP